MRRVATLAALALVLPAPLAANEFRPMLESIAESEIADLVDNPVLIEAIRAQNAETEGLTQAVIAGMDADWRAQVGASHTPLIDKVLISPASDALRAVRDEAGGLFSEIFVMDKVGLNVAASDTTSDYWQGDEEKFTETFLAGPEAVHIGPIELDESTQVYQSQVSVPVLDPETRAPIGAATFGINLEMLQ